MNKALLLVLAFYTIVLSCIPCQDKVTFADMEEGQNVIAALQSVDTHESCVDLCSPFCICACCAGITLTKVSGELPSLQSVFFGHTLLFSYKSVFTSNNLSSIWQPPKHFV